MIAGCSGLLLCISYLGMCARSVSTAASTCCQRAPWWCSRLQSKRLKLKRAGRTCHCIPLGCESLGCELTARSSVPLAAPWLACPRFWRPAVTAGGCDCPGLTATARGRLAPAGEPACRDWGGRGQLQSWNRGFLPRRRHLPAPWARAAVGGPIARDPGPDPAACRATGSWGACHHHDGMAAGALGQGPFQWPKG